MAIRSKYQIPATLPRLVGGLMNAPLVDRMRYGEEAEYVSLDRFAGRTEVGLINGRSLCGLHVGVPIGLFSPKTVSTGFSLPTRSGAKLETLEGIGIRIHQQLARLIPH